MSTHLSFFLLTSKAWQLETRGSLPKPELCWSSSSPSWRMILNPISACRSKFPLKIHFNSVLPNYFDENFYIDLTEDKWTMIRQAHRGVWAYHLRVSFTLPKGFPPWGPGGCWCWGCLSPQVKYLSSSLLILNQGRNPTSSSKAFWSVSTRGWNISKAPSWMPWISSGQRFHKKTCFPCDSKRTFVQSVW